MTLDRSMPLWQRIKIVKKFCRGESVEFLADRYGISEDKVRRVLALANNRGAR